MDEIAEQIKRIEKEYLRDKLDILKNAPSAYVEAMLKELEEDKDERIKELFPPCPAG